MKILFDHQIFSMQKFGGISRYFANIQNHLDLTPNCSYENGFFYSRNAYKNNSNNQIANFFGDLFLKRDKTLFKWNQKYSEHLIENNNFNVLHPTYYNPYFLEKSKKPFVITVHDMIHELFPEYFSPNDLFTKYKRLTIEKANHIIAISHSTKIDLQKIYNIDNNKISVIHHGIDIINESFFDKPVKEKNYILYVGDRTGYKNFFKFVKAIAPLLNKNKNIKLICAGGGKFKSTEHEIFIRLNIKENQIKQISADEKTLSSLYQNAICFVYPSIYEGFGLPILEAFNNNCPVVCSNTSCFEEVCGEAAIYFDPQNEENILNAITQVTESQKLQKDLIQKGKIRILNFPLSKCVKETINIYKNLS